MLENEKPEEGTEPAQAPDWNKAGEGCIVGLFGSAVLITIGGLLCLTGIGIILGVPLILAGLVCPFVMPIIGLGGGPKKGDE